MANSLGEAVKKERTYGAEFLLQAQAGVFAVASQLCLRGHLPSFPSLDLGYDIIIGNGLRLQVKTSSLRQSNTKMEGIQKNFGYYFDLRRGGWLSNERKYKKTNLRPYSEVADYFVLWGVEENRFFLAPTNHKRQRIFFNSRTATSQSHNKRLYDQITEGRLREFEDRWDLLDVTATSNELIESVSLETQLTQKEN